MPIGFNKLLFLSHERGPIENYNTCGQTNYSLFFCKANSTDWIFSTTGDNCKTKYNLRIQHCEVHIKTFQPRSKATRVPLLLQSSSFNAEYYRHLPIAMLYLFVARETLCTGMKPQYHGVS